MDARYGAPVPPPGAYGNIPTQRLPTQMQQFDTAPSCVQNAMMTKDKKPFTYTPGGIDLSQIKSPRMAKRIARNAQNEGVSGQPKQSPLIRPNGTENSNGSGNSPTIMMGAAAMGVPFQVFPTPPPPHLQQKSNGNIPPPPPPISNLSAPATSSTINRKSSPTPQSFEPPPMGFRPEIKIPTNPMAGLKKIPKPMENNDFWVEEYKKERSKSPMVQSVGNDSPQSINDLSNCQQEGTTSDHISPTIQLKPQPEINEEPVGNGVSPQIEIATVTNGNKFENGEHLEEKEANEIEVVATNCRSTQKERDEIDQAQTFVNGKALENKAPSSMQEMAPQQLNNSPSTPTPLPSSIKVYSTENSPPIKSPTTPPSPSSKTISSNESSPAVQSSSKPIFNNTLPSPPATSPAAQAQSTPRPSVIFNNVSKSSVSPINGGMSPLQPQQYGSPIQQNIQPPQKNAQVGSIYIPPVPVENLAYKPTPTPTPTPSPVVTPSYQYQLQSGVQDNTRARQSTPLRWMATRPSNKETPEWAKEGNVTPSSINRPQSMYTPQTNNNFTPTFSTTNTYQKLPPSTPTANSGLKLQINSSVGAQPKERIIPIMLEQSPTKASESPKFINYSPRNQSSPANGPSFSIKNPNQFVDQGYNNFISSPMPMSSNGVQTQSRVIPITVDSTARNSGSSASVVIQNNPRGTNAASSSGNTTPNQSKSFRILQKITSTEDGNDEQINQMNQPAELQQPHYSRQMMATPHQQTNNAAIEQLQRMQLSRESGRPGPPMKYPQPPTYVQQRAPYQNDNGQYIPPSQQQAPEPKIYTGSAIPSRSFKILQAMTTPENAGPGLSDL